MYSINLINNSFIRTLFFLLLGFAANESFAALGEKPLKPAIHGLLNQASKKSFEISEKDINLAQYTIHSSTFENGVVVTEFARSDGVVFAIAWAGPVLPNLLQLFGDYFDEYRNELNRLRSPFARGKSVAFQTQKLTVRSNGHMRHFFGNAYVLDLVPVDVNINFVIQKFNGS